MKTQRAGLLNRSLCAVLAAFGVAACALTAQAHPGHPTETPDARQERDRTPPMLSDEDMNLIEVYEVHLDTEPPPRIDIPKEALRKFLEDFKEDDRVPRGKTEEEEFLRADGKDQLALMFKVRARDFYKDVKVRSQIESLREWGSIHRQYVLGFFQPNFGSGQVKGLYLFGQGRDRHRIEMTNFYILTQVQIDGKPLIDRFNPAESLLLQWGLPREEAKFPAPDVKGWRPQFRNTEDKRFEEMVKWVESLIRENQGSEYGIKYQIPGQRREREPEGN